MGIKQVIKNRVAFIRTLFLSVLLLVSLSGLSGCFPYLIISQQDNNASEQSSYPAPDERVVAPEGHYNHLSFEELCTVVFQHEVSSDTLTLNQLVANPHALGIEVLRPATFGNYSLASTEEDNDFYREVLEALQGGHSFELATLEKEEQLRASYLIKLLEQELAYEGFFYYLEPLGPSTGAQAMLPLNLMDFSFRSADDLDMYLELLEDTPRYFRELLQHEKEKEARQTLIAREAMEESINEASSYTGPADTHVLVTAFNEMLVSMAQESGAAFSLTPEEAEGYKQRSLKAVEQYVIPAYEELVTGLEQLLQSCQPGTRIFDYARGAEFYEMELQAYGFAEDAAASASTLDATLAENWDMLMTVSSGLFDSAALDSAVEALGDVPGDYLAYVQEQSRKDFAPAGELTYEIKSAPEAAPNEFVMAYFMIPPVDDPQKNTMVYFPRNIADNVEFYSTIAHEGYPGHMYQTYAYSLEEPHNLSKLLGSVAYREGWAMYAQYEAMRYLKVSYEEQEAYIAYDKFVYALQARVDIGIHFEGWGLEQTERYLTSWGFEAATQDLYDAALKQPLAYLPYGLGFVTFDDLRARAETELGFDFDPLVFHQKLTSVGPLPFELLEVEFDAWLRSTISEQEI